MAKKRKPAKKQAAQKRSKKADAAAEEGETEQRFPKGSYVKKLVMDLANMAADQKSSAGEMGDLVKKGEEEGVNRRALKIARQLEALPPKHKEIVIPHLIYYMGPKCLDLVKKAKLQGNLWPIVDEERSRRPSPIKPKPDGSNAPAEGGGLKPIGAAATDLVDKMAPGTDKQQ